MKAVEARLELRHGGLLRQMQRIEIGREMPDHAIGAHQLNGADGFLCGRAQILFADAAPCARGPLAGQRADQFAVFELQFGVAPPGRPAAELRGREPLLAKLGEKGAPGRVHRFRIFQILGVEMLDEGALLRTGRRWLRGPRCCRLLAAR